MKKASFVFVLFCFSSLLAAANHATPDVNGDPKKKTEEQPTFTLSSGYFSFFDFFLPHQSQPDTTRQIATPQNTAPFVPKATQPKR
jgi:hypothetical protein